jgi:hypothetical protein
MARKPRVFVAGGMNHVYNRIASGEAKVMIQLPKVLKPGTNANDD